MVINQEIIKKINASLVEGIEPYVVILFGSQAMGRSRVDSDLDLAFLSDRQINGYDLFMSAQRLAGELGCEVDLVDLRTASTVFRTQVIGHGKVIYCQDETRRMYFYMQTFKEYALLNEERVAILEQVRERGSVYEY